MESKDQVFSEISNLAISFKKDNLNGCQNGSNEPWLGCARGGSIHMHLVPNYRSCAKL